MAYEFLRQHNREPFTALYYDNEPSLPLESEGHPFRYREAPRYDSMDNIVTNLKSFTATKNIETSSQINFRPEGYVVIGREMWRINSITDTARNTMAAALSKNPPKNKSLQLQKVANPVGMES